MEHPSPYPRPLPPGFQQRWLRRDWGWQRLVAGGQGPALMLVHGLGGSAEDFYDCAPLLAAHYTCLMPDQPGFGLSHKPEAPYTVPWLVEQLRGLAGLLGLNRLNWLGHSLGGLEVLWLALNHPGLVRRLVALCPAGGQPAYSWPQEMLFGLATQGDRLRWFSPRLLRLSAAYVFNQPLWGRPTWSGFEEFEARLQAQWAGVDRPLRERAFIRSARGVLDMPLEDRLAELTRPVLLLEGLGDHVTPQAFTQRLWDGLPPGQSRARLPGGHMAPYLAPEDLAKQVIDFLGQAS